MSNANKQSSLFFDLLPLLALYAGAVVLILLTRNNAAGMGSYWEIFIALTALFSLMSGWSQAYVNNRSRLMYLVKQIFAWGLLLGLLALLRQHGISSALSPMQYSITLLYLLALTSLFVSVSHDAKLFFFGLFAAFGGYLLAVPQNNIVLVEIGKILRIPNAATQQLEMLIGIAVVACLASALVLMNLRGGVMAKRARG